MVASVEFYILSYNR